MTTLAAFGSGDGAHCGLGDWYPEKEKALAAALKSSKPFDTGWYASKKEIASARIHRDGKDVHVEVSVSDDFDTYGMGRALVFGADPKGLEQVREAIYRAWSEAEENQKDNRSYAGYSVIRWSTEIPKWRKAKNVYPRERRKRYPKKESSWVETYIVNISEMDSPPGDNYHFWGWQSDPMEEHPEFAGALVSRPDQGVRPDPKLGIPKKTQEKFEEHAQSLKTTSLRIGDWEIKAWEDKE